MNEKIFNKWFDWFFKYGPYLWIFSAVLGLGFLGLVCWAMVRLVPHYAP